MESRRAEETKTKEPINYYGNPINLITYEGVSKYRSIRRAMSRGHVTPLGIVAPKRPFNNRKRINGTRPLELKKGKNI